MPFIDMVIEDMQTVGDAALDTSAPFDEAAVLSEVRPLRRPCPPCRLTQRRLWT
jgi:hypothetical protein